ncbi:MAG: hypothetical protein KDJ16_17835, partial [Hyphomicrobiales bacterium]|nr:hypothetical protein [Hyphomicrobiales bacterium]
MRSGYPWNVRGIDGPVRETAREAARRSGMSLGEWLNDVIVETAEEEGLEPPRRGRRAPAGRSRRDYRRDYYEDYDDEAGDEVSEVAAAVARLSRQMHTADRHAVSALDELRDRLDGLDRGNDRPGRRRDAGKLAELIEELTGEIDDADAAARVMIDGLRGRANRLASGRGKGGDHRLDAVLEAIRELDDDMLEVESGDRGRNRRRMADAPIADMRDHVDSLYAQRRHVLEEAPDTASADDDARFKRIEEQLASIAGALSEKAAPAPAPAAAPVPGNNDLQRAVAEIDARRHQLDDDARPAVADDIAEITARREMLDGARKSPTPEPRQPELERYLEQLAEKIDGLRKSDQPNPEIAALKSEIGTLKSAVERNGDAMHAVEMLAGKIDSLAEQRNDGVAAATAQLRHEIEALKSTAEQGNAALQAVEILGAKIDRLSQRPNSGEADALKSEIATLKAAVERNGDAMRAVEILAGKIDQIAGNDRGSKEIMALRQEMAEMRAAVSGGAGNQAVEALDGEIRRLSAKLDALAKIATEQVGVERLQSQIAALHDAVDATPAMRALDNLEAGYADIRRRLDQLQSQGVDNAHIADIRQELVGLREQMDRLDARDVLDGLERRVASLDDKVGRLENIGALNDPRLAAEIANRLEALKAAVANPASMQAIQTLEQRINALGEKLDRIDPRQNAALLEKSLTVIGAKLDKLGQAQAPANDALVKSLHGQMQQLNAALNKPADPAPLAQMESRFASLVDTLDKAALASKPDLSGITNELAALRSAINATPAADTRGLEAQMRELAARIEASQRPDASNETLGQLEEQIKRMAAQLEVTDRRFGDVARLEENLGRIQSMLSGAGNGVEAAASRAAEQAVQQLSAQLGRTGKVDDEAVGELRAGLAALQKATSASDQRTIETLDAVQKTLKTIVTRLSSLETEVDGGAKPRTAPKTAKTPVAPAPDQPPPPRPAMPKAAPMTAPITAMTAPISPAAKPEPRLEAPISPAPEVRTAAPGRAPQSHDDGAPEDHRPLEPGSGNPRHDGAPSAFAGHDGFEDTGFDPADPKASFIAAARRAAQAAAAEMAADDLDDGAKRSWLPFNRKDKSAKGVAKARSPREKAAAVAEATGTESAGRFGKIGAAISERKRPILLAMAAIILALGAL